MKLDMFRRICGPEDDMKYRTDPEAFEYTVNNMVHSIEDGWDMPPLIVYYGENSFELNDGNHRWEALSRFGRQYCHVIFWTTEAENLKDLQVYLQNEAV
jgi:hypothetical protein